MPKNLISLARLICLLFILSFYSCSISGPKALFSKKTPHERYAERLRQAGLHQTAMGNSWFIIAEQSLKRALTVKLPYKETGYFPSGEVKAAAFNFAVKRGEQLTITLSKRPTDNFNIYIDLWENPRDSTFRLLASADTTGNPLTYEAEDDGNYIVRLQPELLISGEYTLTISKGPSLAYPINSTHKNNIQSFFGDGRDADKRKHEGVDLFSAFRTPVVAAAAGVVSRVNQNNLGGNVVWLRPEGKNYTLYYAHLDTQLVTDGQQVQAGDTLGLMGNTGNARTTAPHLHFGIYTFVGAVDPLPFIKPVNSKPAEITAALANLGRSVRTKTGTIKLYSTPDEKDTGFEVLGQATPLLIDAAGSGWYRATLPDNSAGYIHSNAVTEAANSIRILTLAKEKPVFEQPDTTAVRKLILEKGDTVDLLGSFKDYHLVRNPQDVVGWLKK